MSGWESYICTGYICLLRFWECLIDTFTRRNFPPKGMNKLSWAVLSLSFGWLTLNRWEGVLESLILDKEKRTFSSLNICWVRVNWGQGNFWMLPWKLSIGYKSNFVNIKINGKSQLKGAVYGNFPTWRGTTIPMENFTAYLFF